MGLRDLFGRKNFGRLAPEERLARVDGGALL